jgi:pyruvate/2-oxoglutarate dehydrogenase complex dihydrolipoamide dehydrogenase (E3) component
MLTTSPPPAGSTQNDAASAPAAAERDSIVVDLCILGAGPAGLALAASAVAYGQSVIVVEKHKMGGTSLNYGTIPATALQTSAERAQMFRSSQPFGIQPFEPSVDYPAVYAQIKDIVEVSAPNAAVERMTGLGVRVIQAAGRFVDTKTLVAGEYRIVARRFVVATGSSPLVPAIPGLDGISFLTTDTIFENRGAIDHLIVIGGGAAGVELAQAHRRLGARVTIIERNLILQRFDPELSSVIKARLASEGIVIIEGAQVDALEAGPGRLRADVSHNGTRTRIEGSHLLIACGRRPAVADIGLDAGKIVVGDEGIKVNAILRTSNRRVYAMGDVIGFPHSTQRAEYHAGLLVETLLFRHAAKAQPHLIPATIHTVPELATVGLTEVQARATYSSIQVLRWPMRENARAVATRAQPGHIKIIADKRGHILGAAMVAPLASELIQVWSLAISKQLNLTDMARFVVPHPSLGEINRKAAINPSVVKVGNALSRRWVKLLAKLG